jgi:predicted phosphodiesterase
MQIAFLSDIHGNIDALDAVLRDIENIGVETMVCLGDVVGYGPEPGECVREILKRSIVTVMGNHEAMMFTMTGEQLRNLDERIGLPLLIARTQLAPDELSALRDMPIAAEMEDMVAVHSSMHDPPAFHYIFEKNDARKNFDEQRTGICFHGHTHVPAIWVKAGRMVHCLRASSQPVVLNGQAQYAVNTGSVGQPRDGVPMASYAIYDLKRKTLLHRRVAYDLQAAVQRFRDAGLPEENFLRLLAGN